MKRISLSSCPINPVSHVWSLIPLTIESTARAKEPLLRNALQGLYGLQIARASLITVAAYLTIFVAALLPKTALAFSPANSPTQSAAFESALFENIEVRWGGRMRTIGSASFADDQTVFEAVGTGTFYQGTADFRLINEIFFSDWGYFETHYESILSGGDLLKKRNQLAELFPEFSEEGFTFFGPVAVTDDRRLMDLTHTIYDTDDLIWTQRLDRLALTVQQPKFTMRLGRQAITWGNGLIFNPMDLFNPFAPTDVVRDYKIGDDIISGQFLLPNGGNFQALYVARRDPQTRNVEADQASLAGKLHIAVSTTEFDVMVAKHFDDLVFGVGSIGYLADATWRMDVTWTFLDNPSTMSPHNYLSLVANMDYSWVWWDKNFYGLVEFYYNGLGENNYSKALLNPDITGRLARGELFVLGKPYLSGEIQIELHPLLNLFLTAINNVRDPSGILQPRVSWNMTDNLQATFGANLTYGGNGSEFGGFPVPGTDLRTKPLDSVYAWLVVYF